MNFVAKILILSDVIIVSAFGFLSPIFALFVTDKIAGGTIETVGYATAFYWLVAFLVRLPLAKRVDSTTSEKDDFLYMAIGSFIICLVPFMYIFSSKIWHIYLIQAIYGLGHSLRVPGWYAMFTKRLGKGKEGYSWSVSTMITGIGSAITAALGGLIANHLGFDTLFIIIGILSIFGSLTLFFIYYYFILQKNKNSEYIEKNSPKR